MPELPEVETIVRGLESLFPARIERLEVRDPRLALPVEEIVDEKIAGIERKGKYIVFPLVSGRSLVVHLRMSGRLVRSCSKQEEAYARLVLHLDRGKVHFVDPRRLGTVEYCSDGFPHPLGADPLDREFTKQRLGKIVRASRAPIKTLLLDQKRIAGIGNIYAAEALFTAKIDPRRPGKSLSEEEVAAAHSAVRSVLVEAIRHLGTTLGESVSDYRNSAGQGGRFQERLNVYGRGGEACRRCGQAVERIRQAGRSTYYCPGCQH